MILSSVSTCTKCRFIIIIIYSLYSLVTGYNIVKHQCKPAKKMEIIYTYELKCDMPAIII